MPSNETCNRRKPPFEVMSITPATQSMWRQQPRIGSDAPQLSGILGLLDDCLVVEVAELPDHARDLAVSCLSRLHCAMQKIRQARLLDATGRQPVCSRAFNAEATSLMGAVGHYCEPKQGVPDQNGHAGDNESEQKITNHDAALLPLQRDLPLHQYTKQRTLSGL